MESKILENVVIIGGGPAGLAAALYASRANLNPLVFAGSPPGGQLTLTSDVENYPGFESILGPELVQKMRKQTENFGTRIFDENVLDVDFSQKILKLKISESALKKVYPESTDLSHINAKSVIIATGAKALWLGLESEQRLRGKGVSACATCDGFFFRNKIVAVIGGGDTAMEESLTMTKFAQKVYVIHRRDSFRASKIMQERVLNHPHIEVIWNSVIEEIVGEQKVEGLKLKNQNLETRNLQLDGVFVAIGHKPDTDLFKEKIELDQKGYIVTSLMKAWTRALKKDTNETADKFDFHYQTATSVPGVFAGGDCVDYMYRQAATAGGMGVAAALDVERYLADLQ